MRNFLFLILITLIISCKEEDTSITVKDQNVSVQLSFPKNSSSAKALSKSLDYKQRVIVEVYWYNDERELELTDKKLLLIDQLSDSYQIDFTLQLNQSYRLLFWSDQASTDGGDLFYSTASSLQQVSSILSNNEVYSDLPGRRDAFYAAKDIDIISEKQTIDITLSRACSVIKIDAKDLHDDSLEKQPDHSILKVQAPSIFNVNDGSMSSVQNFEVHYSISPNTSSREVLSFYLLSPQEYILSTAQTSYLNVNNEEIAAKEFSNIPIKRNVRTILLGSIFTSDVSVDINFDSNFSNSGDDNEGGNSIIIENSANSFILNPSTTPVKYSIPISHQNTYWNQVDPNNVISESTNWKTNLVWNELNSADFDIEKSANPLHIDVVINPGAEGNALVGVYNDKNANDSQDTDEPYLWSYHLWITDYNPDQSISISSEIFEYPVNGGKVHRIPGEKWKELSYSKARMMDRNVGELSDRYSEEGNGILFFQYGRKDPFPINFISDKDCSTLTSIKGSIYNPNKLFTKVFTDLSPSYFQWTTENVGAEYSWSDLSTKDKSNFDPCPYGWSIPTHQELADIIKMPKTEVSSIISYGDLIRFRKYGFLGASQLELSTAANFLLCSDINNEAPYSPYVLNDIKFTAIHRSAGIPVRCIKRN